MSFHESFWVVVGTAAPIIALAAIVALFDLERVMLHASREVPDVPDADEGALVRALIRYGVGVVTGYVNVVLQAVTLLLALLSLAAGHNQVSVLVAEITIPLGIVLLLVTSSAPLGFRRLMAKRRGPGGEAERPSS